MTPRSQTTPAAPTRRCPVAPASTPGRVGDSMGRPDGVPKVRGEFGYSSDLWVDGMLWGATLRSPHPHTNIRSIGTTEAEAMPGVYAVLTHKDMPGRKVYGMEIPDQPVLAWERVRYQGEPVAIVAADHPETARRALEKISVEYEVLDPVTDAEEAMDESAPKLHLSGNVLRRIHIRHGDVDSAAADVVVTGEYKIGMQDQAFLGPESGMAVPDGEGGVDLYISTQWLHIDQDQVAKCAPPLRPQEDLESLWEQIRASNIEFVTSDYSPCSPDMKVGDDMFRTWGGIAGCQSLMNVMLDQGRHGRGLPLDEVAALLSGNVADRFGFSGKGLLEIGADVDLTLVNLDELSTPRREDLLYRYKMSPYAGRAFTGKVVRTIVRGSTVFREGEIVPGPTGRLVKPDQRSARISPVQRKQETKAEGA